MFEDGGPVKLIAAGTNKIVEIKDLNIKEMQKNVMAIMHQC